MSVGSVTIRFSLFNAAFMLREIMLIQAAVLFTIKYPDYILVVSSVYQESGTKNNNYSNIYKMLNST